MRKMLTMLVALVSFTVLYGQSWETVKVAGDVFNPYGAYYFDASNGILVGYEGAIYKTTDGGLTTTAVIAETTGAPQFSRVDFANANTGYAVGSSGKIMKSADGGNTWTDVSDSTVMVDLKGVAAVSDLIAYVAGEDSTMLKTVDGGATWVKSSYGFEGNDLDGGVAFADADHGVVIADAVGAFTWYTTDGGMSWTPVIAAAAFPVGVPSTRLYDVDFVGNTVILAGYSYVVLKSTDGGQTYAYTGPFSYGYDYNKTIEMVDENTIYVGGSDGWLVKTSDGGANWVNLSYSSGNTISVMCFPDANDGFIYGANDQFFSTADGGTNWSPLNDWPASSMWGLSLPTDDKIVVSFKTGGELSISEDGGETWSYPVNTATGSVGTLYECEFSDADTGIVAGSSGDLRKTVDGGASFTFKDNPMYNTDKDIKALRYVSGDVVLAGGSSGIIMKSADAGETWTQSVSGTGFTGTVYDMYPVAENLIVATASSGQIGSSVDGGANFTLARDYGKMDMKAVEARNGVMIVAASTGLIYRLTDFSKLDSLEVMYTDPDVAEFYDVEFVTDDLVYVVGSKGKIMKSEDAGLTWTQDSEPGTSVYQKCAYRNYKLWVIGQNGTILLLDMTPPDPITGIVINEFLASNDGSVMDEFGGADDYFELYNTNDFSVNVGGLYVTDHLDEPMTWQIPTTAPDTTTIPAYGYLLIWADKETAQGVLHTNIKLSGGGEAIGLAQDIAGTIHWVDSLTFGPQIADTSYGQLPDASGNWAQMPPTPGAANKHFPVAITFQVNMAYQMHHGHFNAASDQVDIAGTFNNWTGDGLIYCTDEDGDSVYQAVIDLTPGTTAEYKFRINGSWDTSEFPGGGPNRTYLVPDEPATVTVWYNNDVLSSVEDIIPVVYSLHQNYPNPFNPLTKIAFDLPENDVVTLTIYNVNGQAIRTLFNNQMTTAGKYSIIWDATTDSGRPVSSGIYFYSISTPKYHATQRMVYLK